MRFAYLSALGLISSVPSEAALISTQTISSIPYEGAESLSRLPYTFGYFGVIDRADVVLTLTADPGSSFYNTQLRDEGYASYRIYTNDGTSSVHDGVPVKVATTTQIENGYSILLHDTPPGRVSNFEKYATQGGFFISANFQGSGTLRIDSFDIGTAPVPEPSLWSTLILGFGFVGAATRASRSPRRLRVRA